MPVAFKQSAVVLGACLLMAMPLSPAMAALSDSDRSAIVRAIEAASKEQYSSARAQIAGIKDPLPGKLIGWMQYTRGENTADFATISAFVRSVPDWPRQGALALKVEKSITSNTPDDQIIEWFAYKSPQTVDGMMNYLHALLIRNRMTQMTDVLNTWWGTASLSAAQQDKVLKSYGKVITRDSHKARLNRTMHRGEYAQARAIAALLGKGYPELAEARIALASGDSGVDYVVSRVPAQLQNDPEFALERLRWRRKKNMDFKAIEILHNAPSPALIPNLEEWWKERHILARRLIEGKQYESAYLLVKNHGLKSGSGYADAEFLAGWLALRFMKKPWVAFQHFEALYNASAMPITKGRAAFWAGVASEDLKHPEIAKQWFEVGARYPTVYYGQLSLAKLGRHAEPVMKAPALPAQVRLAFEADERIRIARLFHAARDRSDASLFLRHYADSAQDAAQFHLVAGVANDWDYLNDSVAIAKKAQAKGVVLADYAFPTMLKRMKGVNGEWALIHAIIRQESAFDVNALSPVGARGLMQLMPATAREVARKEGIQHENDWLTTRPDHNIRLGNGYIKQMLARFNGSYPLAIAAYNAGPGRVNQWIAQFGDPRKGDVDMLDWIEIIPVAETRNYVQRVLEGVYVYRQKFNSVQKISAPIHVHHFAD